MSNEWSNLSDYARKKYSQCGEEGVIDRIFELIGTTNRVALEFGAGDGYNLSNTRHLVDKGWHCHMWDGGYETEAVHKRFITVENINVICAEEGVPHDFDLLSIDIDGNDYWIWKAMEQRPRVVVIEFNASIAPGRKCTVPYDPTFAHDKTLYYGASFDLLCQLGREKGYVPVCQLMNLNLFFVLKELVPEPPAIEYTQQFGHLPDTLNREWLVF